MPHPDGVPTRAEMEAAENKRYQDAIRACHGFGMDEKALLGAVMRYIQGKGNPTLVLRHVRQYLTNGHRFT